MTLAVAILALLLAATAAALARREVARRRLQRELGGGDPHEAVRRLRRTTVPRAELSAAIASREALLEAVDQPLIVFDARGIVRRANTAARERLGGVEPGRAAADVAALPALASAVAEALRGEDPVPFDVTVYEPERRRFEVRVQGYPDEDGRGCVAALREDTAEADYREARQLFSAGVSHELRTPLARILGLVETLSLPLAEDERQATIDQAQAEVVGMRRLIEEMILLARIESEGPDADDGERESEIEGAIETAVARHAGAAREAGVRLRGGSTRGLVAAIAPALLDTVLDNLVENAIRHAGRGADVTVSARGLAGAVEVTVSDTGQGIEARHLSRVFERFYRAEDARSGPGSGLGLAIVKHIAEAHGGRATLSSAAGAGVTVRVVLPAPAARRRAG